MKNENWIKWDIDSRSGWKMASFFAEFGATGYGVFLILIEMLYRAKGHKLTKGCKAMQTYTKVCKVDANVFKAIQKELIELELLLEDETHFWSPRVIEEREKIKHKNNKISEIRKEAANTRWRNKDNENSNIEEKEEQEDDMQKDAKLCKAMQTDAKPCKTDRGEEIRGDKRRGEERDIKGVSKKQPPGFRKDCIQYGEYKHVYLKQDEYLKLCSDYGQSNVDSKITSMDSQIENKIKKYLNFKNHHACFRSWLSSDAAAGKLKKSAGSLPPGFEFVSKGIIQAPDGKNYQESFLRANNFFREQPND